MKQKPHRFLGITSTLLALLTLMPSAYADPASETPAPTAPATATTKDPPHSSSRSPTPSGEAML